MKFNFFDKHMAAATFAEAGEHETSIQMLEADDTLQKPLANEGEVKISKAPGKLFETAAMATTFAEAGEHATARQILTSRDQDHALLVFGSDNGFSKVLMDYSVKMAARIKCSVIAASITDAPLRLPVHAREAATAEFIEKSNQYAKKFADKAEEHGLYFSHIIEFGNHEKIIEQIHTEHPNIQYCLTEPDPEIANEMPENISIPVFNFATSGI
ncbi:MAG: hypothetical protein KKE17_14095 [Proteobacteria bacterium]|nr:hypothetical protein [Pseudomonadota bacterium]MBU1711131.1 hypothetical protein [Pseudomonadota bacterium]